MAKDRIETELRANSAQLRSEFGKAQKKVKKFTDGVKRAATSVAGLAAGAIGIRAGVAIFGDLADRFDRIGKLSNRFNLPEEDVQRLAVAAEVTGSSLEKVVAALTKATVSGVEAGQGLETYGRAFRELGVNVADFNAVKPDEKLSLLAKAFNEAEDESTAFAAAYRILGKSGGDLIPLLRENADGIDRLSKNLKTLDASEVKAIEQFNDEMTLLKRNLQAEIGKEFAGELSGMKDEIKEVGMSIANATKFLLHHRKAIQYVVTAWAAYKGVKVTASLVKALTVMARTKLELLAGARATALSTAATEAETASTNKNTAAHLANGRARALARVRGSGKSAGGSQMGVAMGVGAAESFGKTFLGKVAFVGLAAQAGWMLGSPLGERMAEALGENFDKGFKSLNDPLNSALEVSAELVKSAKTQADTDDARVQIKRMISNLEEMSLVHASAERKEMVAITIETLKRRDAMADVSRERQLQMAASERETAELARQRSEMEFHAKMSREAEKAAERRAAHEAKAAKSLREQVAALAKQVVDTQVDLLPAEDRVKRFGAQLKKQLHSAGLHHNVSRRLDGKEEVAPAKDIGDVYRMAQKARAEGDIKQAELLLQQVREMQVTQRELSRAKDEVNAKEREQLELVKQQNEAKNRQLEKKAGQDGAKREIAGEIAALKLEAQGRLEAAEALRKSVRLREEAQRIAEQTGVSEKDALAIAKQRDVLREKAAKAKARAEGGGGAGEGLRERIRRERAERIQLKRAEREERANGGRGRMGIGGGMLRKKARDERLAPEKKRDAAIEKFDRLIGQNDELLGVWKKLTTSS